MMAQHNHRPVELDKLFSNAKSSFLTTLAPEERCGFATCESADKLISDIQQFLPHHRARRALLAMDRIRKFSNYLEPYFKVIEIVCQSNAEWTCIAWGAFRLVLQVSNSPALLLALIVSQSLQPILLPFFFFFEKLSKLIETLTASLPQYTEYYELLRARHTCFSQSLPDSLMRFYVDVLDFFQAVADVFTKPSGSMTYGQVPLLFCTNSLCFQN
jgi:hypothetical protein